MLRVAVAGMAELLSKLKTKVYFDFSDTKRNGTVNVFVGRKSAKHIPQSRLFCYAYANPPLPRNSRCDDEHGYQRTTHDSRC
jgi:hypothetical protein